MILQKIEDFEVFKKAKELWTAVNAILERPSVCSNRDLKQQLTSASDSVLANLAEGFEQPTDRAFAKYVYTAKASAAEVRQWLQIAHDRKLITPDELSTPTALCDHVSRLAAGLIAHLLKSNRKDRGTGNLQRTTTGD